MSSASAQTKIALGIICEDNKVLLVERKVTESGTDGSTLRWVFPGGKLEGQETPEQAVIREIREETGYDTAVIGNIADGLHPHFPVYVYYFSCALQSKLPLATTTDPAIANSIWIPKSDIHNFITSKLNADVDAFLKQPA